MVKIRSVPHNPYEEYYTNDVLVKTRKISLQTLTEKFSHLQFDVENLAIPNQILFHFPRLSQAKEFTDATKEFSVPVKIHQESYCLVVGRPSILPLSEDNLAIILDNFVSSDKTKVYRPIVRGQTLFLKVKVRKKTHKHMILENVNQIKLQIVKKIMENQEKNMHQLRNVFSSMDSDDEDDSEEEDDEESNEHSSMTSGTLNRIEEISPARPSVPQSTTTTISRAAPFVPPIVDDVPDMTEEQRTIFQQIILQDFPQPFKAALPMEQTLRKRISSTIVSRFSQLVPLEKPTGEAVSQINTILSDSTQKPEFRYVGGAFCGKWSCMMIFPKGNPLFDPSICYISKPCDSKEEAKHHSCFVALYHFKSRHFKSSLENTGVYDEYVFSFARPFRLSNVKSRDPIDDWESSKKTDDQRKEIEDVEMFDESNDTTDKVDRTLPSEVEIRNIPSTVDNIEELSAIEREVVSYCSVYGPVHYCRVSHEGDILVANIKFRAPRAALNASRSLGRNAVFQSCEINLIQRPNPVFTGKTRALVVKGLLTNMSNDDLIEEFSEFCDGDEPALFVEIPRVNSMNIGFAYIQFPDIETVKRVIDHFNTVGHEYLYVEETHKPDIEEKAKEQHQRVSKQLTRNPAPPPPEIDLNDASNKEGFDRFL